MKQLSQQNLTEQQFAQLIGRARLYHYLPKKEKSLIPELLLNDGYCSHFIYFTTFANQVFFRGEKLYSLIICNF